MRPGTAATAANPGVPPPPAGSQPGAYQPVGAPPASYAGVVSTASVKYGGFWIRVVAAIIDNIIIRAAAWPIGAVFGLGGMAGMMGGAPFGGLGLHMLGGGIMVVVVLFGSWLYEAFMLSSSYQATLGKMIFGMKVTDLRGNRLSFAHATGRHFAKLLSLLTLCIGYLMVGFTERKQGLHDMVAGTLVRIS